MRDGGKDARARAHQRVQAILAAHVPAIVGFTLFTCFVTVLTSLIADVMCAFVDPRARLYERSNHP